MSLLSFKRIDLEIVVRRTEDGGATVRVGYPGSYDELQFSPEQTSDLATSLFLSDKTAVSNSFSAWHKRIDEAKAQLKQDEHLIPRIALDIIDPEFSSHLWESLLALWVPPPVSLRPMVVRVSQMRPRWASVPFPVPLRILNVEPENPGTLPTTMRKLIGQSQPDEIANQAVKVDERQFSELTSGLTATDWPTAEIIHFENLPSLNDETTLLRTSLPERIGTLGWFARVCDLWETRLIVIECHGYEVVAAHRLATALINRSGPAVLISGHVPHPKQFLTEFYLNLLHDFPIDKSVLNALLLTAALGPPPLPLSLFAGARREGALRISRLGLALLKLQEEWSTTPPERVSEMEHLVRTVTRRKVVDLAARGKVFPHDISTVTEAEYRESMWRVQQRLSKLKSDWENFTFEFHERQGYVPLTERVTGLRAAMNSSGPLSYESAPYVTAPRYVNASLWSDKNDEQKLEQLDQTTTRLIVGQVYHLGIQIGPKDIRIRTFGETALIEEVFNWSPEMKGVWVEFAITGIDFDVLGDPVRDLWLPRDRPSEMIYFAISPRRAGACRLRYCLYYQQNVIQSFRLAAITVLTPQEPDHSPKIRRQQLSRALDLPIKEIGDAAYLPRLEYSLTTSVDSLETRPPRVMSIVANDLNGQPVVTVKGADDFRVLTPSDLKHDITAVREAFTDISANELKTEKDRLKWPYAFGQYAAQPQTLEAALKKLAEVGWALYDKIFTVKTQDRLGEVLSKDPKVIHVAHILLDKVIPWAALYDRQYDPDMTEDDDLKPVDHAACLAALPDANGEFPVLECGKHPDCLLHPDQIKKRESAPNAKRLVPETVACPLHFWGFKHIIEIPPQQVDEKGKTIPQPDFILAGGSVQMISGANVSLKLWPKHLEALNKFPWKAQAVSVATLKKALKDADLDFIYLYCHAGGGETDPAGYNPHLLFQDEQAKPQKIRPGAFPSKPKWAHHPLVFLNGCGTLGYTPDALSPFIKKLVVDLEAGGVIGTEITVWEELAIDVAEDFLKKFLAPSSAGDALLAVRRSLLAKKNPLGLVYTLYAPAHLKLKS